MSESDIENYEEYKPKKQPYTFADWLMLGLSACLTCLAIYYKFGGK